MVWNLRHYYASVPVHMVAIIGTPIKVWRTNSDGIVTTLQDGWEGIPLLLVMVYTVFTVFMVMCVLPSIGFVLIILDGDQCPNGYFSLLTHHLIFLATLMDVCAAATFIVLEALLKTSTHV